MLTVYALMGQRRQEKIAETLAAWRTQVSTRAPKGTRFMATCHPTRPRVAHGLCHTCYMRQYKSGGPLRHRDPQPWRRKRSTKADLA
jgi:uncharacterized paraquat-inducible protein A